MNRQHSARGPGLLHQLEQHFAAKSPAAKLRQNGDLHQADFPGETPLIAVDVKTTDDVPADFPPYDVYPTRKNWVPLSGVLSSARGSDAAKGKLIADEVGRRMAEAIEARFP